MSMLQNIAHALLLFCDIADISVSGVRLCGQVIEASVPSDESGRKMTRTFKREGARFVPGESDDEEEDGA